MHARVPPSLLARAQALNAAGVEYDEDEISKKELIELASERFSKEILHKAMQVRACSVAACVPVTPARPDC